MDYALVVPDKPCPGAGVFTTNRFCARRAGEPCQPGRCRQGLWHHRRCFINSGNANAATGETGLACARETCNIASQVIGCEPQQILVASTGVIVRFCRSTRLRRRPVRLRGALRHGGADAARAIMTTDTHSKEYAVCYRSEAAGHAGNAYTVGGMCKGSGMIMPNMATMIAVITTDAPVEPEALHTLLLSTVKQTFNKVTVDSDTSTNDTCIMLASGAAAADTEAIVEGTDAFDELSFAVHGCARAWRATSRPMARARQSS
ncbi:MAG: bifunctional ornithine acetyltransferase/N-acetylglutamate synthase [Collinsella sp.]